VGRDHVLVEVTTGRVPAEPYVGIGSEMDDDIGAMEEVRQTVGLGEEIALHRVEVVGVTGRFEVASEPGAQVVERDDPMPAREQVIDQVRTDESGTARDDDSHTHPFAINWRRL
jgi:hypothetical protein